MNKKKNYPIGGLISLIRKYKFFIKILSCIILIFVFLVADIVAITNIYAEENPQITSFYEVKRNFTDEPEKALFITSNYSGDFAAFFERKFLIFKDIVASHWNVEITMIPQEKYLWGMVNDYDIIFYIKEENETLPAILMRDLSMARNKRIILSGYNRLVVNRVTGLDIPAIENVFSDIEYKGVEFYDQKLTMLYDTSYLLDIKEEIAFFGSASDSSPEKTYPVAFTFDNSKTNGQNLKSTYLALPFLIPDRYAINNYSIIFLDLLYEGFGRYVEPELKPALLRLEDINVYTYYQPSKLQRVYNFLKKNKIPFHIAFIVKYVNPEKNISMLPKDGRRFYNLLSQMVGEGYGTLIQHGYTHQIGSSISGIGFEFWDEDKNAPLEYESEDFVIERIQKAKEEMIKADLPVPDIWETPHYAASELADNVFNQYYPIRYEAIRDIGSLPFVAKINGTVYIPENLGFISDELDDFVYGHSVEDIEENLKFLSVFRDPVASIFWHPWRRFNEIKQLVNLIENNGHTFVNVYDLLVFNKQAPASQAALTAYQKNYSPSTPYLIANIFIAFIYIFFVFGCIIYIRTIFRLKLYAKVFDKFNMRTQRLQSIFRAKGEKFPFFTIFVPARNEGFVIENTVKNLARLSYPKPSYRVVVIVDEREINDNVKILTKNIVRKIARKINKKYGVKLINIVEVPSWYSGRYNDFAKDAKKSTKGRALNYALQIMSSRKKWRKSDMICVLDADGRLHLNVLKEAAFNRVINKSKVLQGPVLQVSNFNNVGIVGIAAGIELAIHHLTELPNSLINSKRAQFLAGTNYFIDRELITEVGGWDQDALVEDAELALRIFIKKGIKANWIGLPEIEQTPENFSVYKKQRSRWVRGHLDLLKIIRQASICKKDKLYLYWKIFVSQFRFVFDLGFPVLSFLFLFFGLLLDLGQAMGFLSLALLIFAVLMWELYGYVYRKTSFYINPKMKINQKVLMSLKLFFFSPAFIFIQSIPRISALLGYLRSAPLQWYKTERTPENPSVTI